MGRSKKEGGQMKTGFMEWNDNGMNINRLSGLRFAQDSSKSPEQRRGKFDPALIFNSENNDRKLVLDLIPTCNLWSFTLHRLRRH